MNWFDWTILGAVVVLWLRLEVLFHKHDVLRAGHDEARASNERTFRYIRSECLSWLEFSEFSQRIRDRLDKLDPPLRRATDKKKAKR